MALVSAFDGDFEFNLSASNTMSLSQDNTVAGGRVSGGGGDTITTYEITYDSAGSSADQGMVVYVDASDGEAKLASYDESAEEAEVVGFLTEDVSAGATTMIQTEGEISLDDWTSVAGTATLTPGALYFLHQDGQIRVTAPVSGRVVVVGRAVTSLKLDSEIDSPLVLS
jgi:hypothetical protein